MITAVWPCSAVIRLMWVVIPLSLGPSPMKRILADQAANDLPALDPGGGIDRLVGLSRRNSCCRTWCTLARAASTVADMRRLGRVGAEQGTAKVAPRDMLGNKVLIAQLRQRHMRLAPRQPRQAGRSRNCDIRPRMYPQQAKHPPSGLA